MILAGVNNNNYNNFRATAKEYVYSIAGAFRWCDSLIVAMFFLNLSYAFLNPFTFFAFHISFGVLFHILTTLLLKKLDLTLELVTWLVNDVESVIDFKLFNCVASLSSFGQSCQVETFQSLFLAYVLHTIR